MKLAQRLVEDFEKLPDDKKQEVIDFIEFLKAKTDKEIEKLMDTIIDDNREALEGLAK